VQELARLHAPRIIVELARLALKAKSETARIAAIRELLDRGYGRPRQAMEVSVSAGDPIQLLLDDIDARSRMEAPMSHTPDRNQLPLACMARNKRAQTAARLGTSRVQTARGRQLCRSDHHAARPVLDRS
jgi:hypothetical protein